MSKGKRVAAPPPLLIDDTNLSRAWGRLLLHVLDGAGTEVAPLILSLSGFEADGTAAEDATVRQSLDRLLKRKGRRSGRCRVHALPAAALGHVARG